MKSQNLKICLLIIERGISFLSFVISSLELENFPLPCLRAFISAPRSEETSLRSRERGGYTGASFAVVFYWPACPQNGLSAIDWTRQWNALVCHVLLNVAELRGVFFLRIWAMFWPSGAPITFYDDNVFRPTDYDPHIYNLLVFWCPQTRSLKWSSVRRVMWDMFGEKTNEWLF